MQTFPDLKLAINCKDSFQNMGNFWDAKCFKQVLYFESDVLYQNFTQADPLYDLLLRTRKQSKNVSGSFGGKDLYLLKFTYSYHYFLTRYQEYFTFVSFTILSERITEFLKYFLE